MTDLSTILPHYTPTNTRLCSIFEAHNLTTADLLTLDATDISRRITDPKAPQTAPPLLEIKRFATDLISALHADTPTTNAAKILQTTRYLTTGDATLDSLLSGGIPTGALTEFVGESGAGKTQFLLTLTLTAQLPPEVGGLGKSAVYISTESPLSTPRLLQIATSLNARLATRPPVTTDKVHTIVCNDLETQDHILRYQLPVMVARANVGLVIIDSIAANFRAEYDRPAKRFKLSPSPGNPAEDNGPAQMARRGGELVSVAYGLRELARKNGVAVVVANQVSDKFATTGRDEEEDEMALDYQAKWFTGWEKMGKVPALGLVWANLLAGRVVLKLGEEEAERKRKRRVGVVWANWAEAGGEREFEIWEGGVRGVVENEEEGTSIYA